MKARGNIQFRLLSGVPSVITFWSHVEVGIPGRERLYPPGGLATTLSVSLSPAARKTTATAAQEASLTKLSQQKVAAAAPTYIRKSRGDRSSGVKAGVKTFSLTCSFGKADTHWMTSEEER